MRQHVAAERGGDEKVAVLHAGRDALEFHQATDGVVLEPVGEHGFRNGVKTDMRTPGKTVGWVNAAWWRQGMSMRLRPRGGAAASHDLPGGEFGLQTARGVRQAGGKNGLQRRQRVMRPRIWRRKAVSWRRCR